MTAVPARRRAPVALLALAALLASASCAGTTDAAYPAVAPAASGPSCPAPADAAPRSILDWETQRQQAVPDEPPPGWSPEYARDLVHDDGQPQISIVRRPQPVRAGAAAARFELQRGDPIINHGTRAELATPLAPRGADLWYALSFYLPTTWRRDRSAEILAQWHQQASIEGNPPLAIATQNGQWEIQTARDSFDAGVNVGAYRTGRWTDWLVHVKWSTGADGVVQIWRDGRPVAGFTDRRGPNTYRSPDGVYFKVGLYKWDWSLHNPTDTSARVMYVDEVRIATTRAAVAVPPATPDPACYRPDLAAP